MTCLIDVHPHPSTASTRSIPRIVTISAADLIQELEEAARCGTASAEGLIRE